MVTPKRNQLDPGAFIPLWSAEMGARLKTARQAMDLNQDELARDLGVSQATVAKLEAGRSRGSRAAITINQWSTVLGDHTRFVLLGFGEKSYDADRIRIQFMAKRFNGRCPDPDNKSYVNRRKKRLTLK